MLDFFLHSDGLIALLAGGAIIISVIWTLARAWINFFRGDKAVIEEQVLTFTVKRDDFVETLLNGTVDRGLKALFTHLRAITLCARGDFAEATARANEALRLYEEIGDKNGVFTLTHLLDICWPRSDEHGGKIFYDIHGDVSEVTEMVPNAPRFDAEPDAKESIARQYTWLGEALEAGNDFIDAEEMYLKALELFEELGDKSAVTFTVNNLASVCRNSGNLHRAEEFYLKGLQLDKEIGDKKMLAATNGDLGDFYEQKGDISQACAYWCDARDLWREVGDLEQTEIYEELLRKAELTTA
jgi:tetratricopeptide (TPR) repeat protein